MSDAKISKFMFSHEIQQGKRKVKNSLFMKLLANNLLKQPLFLNLTPYKNSLLKFKESFLDNQKVKLESSKTKESLKHTCGNLKAEHGKK